MLEKALFADFTIQYHDVLFVLDFRKILFIHWPNAYFEVAQAIGWIIRSVDAAFIAFFIGQMNVKFQLTQTIQYAMVEYQKAIDDHDVDGCDWFIWRIEYKTIAQFSVQIVAHLCHIQGSDDIVVDMRQLFNPFVMRIVVRIEA